MEPVSHNSPDTPSGSVLDRFRLFRDKLLDYANLADAIIQRKASRDGHDKRMTLWQELSEDYGRLQWIIDEAVIDSEPATWRAVLTPPFNRSTPSSIMRLATIVSEVIGRLQQDIVDGLRDENGVSRHGDEPKTTNVAPQDGSHTSSFDAMSLHALIESVSRRLYEDGHYAPAIFEAFKAVGNFVKTKSGSRLDGERLMAAAFKEDNPLLCVNGGRTQSEMDERKGLKFIYMGALTGIRNPKAHENVNQDDPVRTLKYLALASLLVEVAEQAQIPSDGAAPRDENA